MDRAGTGDEEKLGSESRTFTDALAHPRFVGYLMHLRTLTVACLPCHYPGRLLAGYRKCMRSHWHQPL